MARALENTQRWPWNETPEIVPLGRDRAEEVCVLEQRCYPSPWSSDLIRAEFEREICYRLGLTFGGEVVAYSFSYVLPPDLHLLNIAVAPEHRGKGFGRHLLANLMLHALDENVERVSLEVRVTNTLAQSLYRKLGFRAVGTRHAYYRDNGEDALLLELQLSPTDAPFLEQMQKLK